MKRVLSWFMALTMILICSGFSVSAASFENTYKNTGNGQTDIVEVAKTQIGYYEGYEGSNGYTKYGDWYHAHYAGGDKSFINAPWCAMFVSWCSDQAGTIGVTGSYAYCPYWVSYFKNNNHWKSRGSGYIPAKGDIIFFCWDGTGVAGHVGIVYDSNEKWVYTIEGNSDNDACVAKQYLLTNDCILGYGTPAYGGRTEYATKTRFALVANSNLTIDRSGNYLLGLTDKTKASSLSSQFTNGNVDFSNVTIATGSKIVLKDDSGKQTDSLTIIVRGDLNGDGSIDSLDYMLLKRGIIGTSALSDIQIKAGTLSGDELSSLDYLRLKRYILGNLDRL